MMISEHFPILRTIYATVEDKRPFDEQVRYAKIYLFVPFCIGKWRLKMKGFE